MDIQKKLLKNLLIANSTTGANIIKLYTTVSYDFLCLPFQPNLLFMGKARSLPLNGAPERGFTWVGSCLARKHKSIIERLAKDKHSSLLRIFVTYGRKKFYNIGPRDQNFLRS
jgi:hypothetical protein